MKRRKYPRHCCKRCDTMHHSYAAAEKHKRALGHHTRMKRRKTRLGVHANGFGALPKKKRIAVARKGGMASARARGYR